MTTSESPHIDRRFERLGRLITEDGVRLLNRCQVVVCGMGGVGSWAAESLGRSGIGKITLVDFDRVSLTTINRQLPAMDSTVGRPKVEVIAERLRSINPQMEVNVVFQRLNPETIPVILAGGADYVVDAIDQLGNKCALIVHCLRAGIPVVTSTCAGGRLDPTMVRVTDLNFTAVDPLARMVRVYLRKKYGFPTIGPYCVPAVFSAETPRDPIEPQSPEAERSKLELTSDAEDFGDQKLSEMRNVIMGTICFVTSVFGMACASVVVRHLLEKNNIKL